MTLGHTFYLYLTHSNLAKTHISLFLVDPFYRLEEKIHVAFWVDAIQWKIIVDSSSHLAPARDGDLLPKCGVASWGKLKKMKRF